MTMSEKKRIIVLLTAAALVRVLIFVLFSKEHVAGSDQIRNIWLARQFADGDIYGSLDTYWSPVYPVIVGIVTYIVDDIVLPAVIVSIVAGTISVGLIYLLTRQSYGVEAATIAAAIAILFPHLVNSVFSVGTENLYMLWIIGALYVGWRALESGSMSLSFLTGLLLGLGYLTRPEAFAYPLFFAVALIAKNIFSNDANWRCANSQFAVLMLGFVLLAAPYIYYLKVETGVWTVSAKTEINTVASDYEELAVQDGRDAESHDSPLRFWIIASKLVASNLVQLNNVLPYLVPIGLVVLIGLGLFGSVWRPERFHREAYLITFCALTLAGYILAVVQLRYLYILLPIIFGWLACGIIRLQHQLSRSALGFGSKKAGSFFRSGAFSGICVAAIILYAAPLYFFAKSDEKAWQQRAFEERDAGLWLKAQGKPDPLIFSATMVPVFYAEGKQVTPTSTELHEILREVRNNVDYVVISERSLKRNPYLTGLAGSLQDTPDFELIYDFNERPGYRIVIFERR